MAPLLKSVFQGKLWNQFLRYTDVSYLRMDLHKIIKKMEVANIMTVWLYLVRQNLFTSFNTFLASRMPMFSRCFQVHVLNIFKPKAGISRKLLPTLPRWSMVIGHWAWDVCKGSFFLTPCLGENNQEGWCIQPWGCKSRIKWGIPIEWVVTYAMLRPTPYRTRTLSNIFHGWKFKMAMKKGVGVKSQGCESNPGWKSFKIFVDCRCYCP